MTTAAAVARRSLIGLAALVLILAASAPRPASAAAAPDLRVDMTGPTRVGPGETLNYIFAVQNFGDVDSDGTGSLDVTLPPGVTVVSVANHFGIPPSFDWTCADPVDDSSLHCDLATPVAPRQAAVEQVVLTARLDSAGPGPFTANATFSGGGDADPSTASTSFVVSPTPDFGIQALDGMVADGAGNAFTQAGGHPVDATVSFATNTVTRNGSAFADGGDLRAVDVDLPPGLVGNPSANACPSELIVPNGHQILDPNLGPSVFCPTSSIVGVAVVTAAQFGRVTTWRAPVFNVEPPSGVPAQFAFAVDKYSTYLNAALRADGQYALGVQVKGISQGLSVLASSVTFWGTPNDPSHDNLRCLSYGSLTSLTDCRDNFQAGTDPLLSPMPASGARAAFLTNPTACTAPGEGLLTTMRVAGWDPSNPTDSASFVSHNPPGYPLPLQQWGAPQGPTGCEDVPFTPHASAQPSSSAADAPTGLDFEISVPTDGLENPSGIAQSHLKKAVVTLPEGMAVNPSSADGLGACSEAQIALGSDAQVACPESSKVGTVSAVTPLLDEPVGGAVYLAEQGNRLGRGSNPFGSLLALYIVVESKERGVLIKLPGRVDADPRTGQLRATFDNNPQLPFSSLRVQMKSGPRAPLVTPSACGTYEVVSELYPWARPASPVRLSSTFKVDRDCAPGGFSPSWSAGSTSPVAGSFSPFVARFSRGEREQRFDGISVEMPKGVLGKIAGVPLCSEAAAGAGACPAGSRVGSATAGAGAGPAPFYLEDQPVYLTGPYKGAPYGLAVVVHAVAGPFDLGNIVVRQAVHIDRRTAQVRVVSDPLPRILEGVPLNIRDVQIEIDRPRFTLNPTSCADKQVRATLTSTDGGVHAASSRFQLGDCASLAFEPKLALRLTGRKQTHTGRHPGIRAAVAQTGLGEAAVKQARVELPKSLALDPDNAQALCEFADGTRPDLESRCPKGSIVGRAKAVTPLLDKPLTGNVYFVKNVRRSASGNLIRTLPMIVVALRGEIAINLTGLSSTTKAGRLVSTFAEVPDAPISRFTLGIRGGSSGILVVTRTRAARIDLCAHPGSHRARVRMSGQNGRRVDFVTRVKAPCGRARKP